MVSFGVPKFVKFGVCFCPHFPLPSWLQSSFFEARKATQAGNENVLGSDHFQVKYPYAFPIVWFLNWSEKCPRAKSFIKVSLLGACMAEPVKTSISFTSVGSKGLLKTSKLSRCFATWILLCWVGDWGKWQDKHRKWRLDLCCSEALLWDWCQAFLSFTLIPKHPCWML